MLCACGEVALSFSLGFLANFSLINLYFPIKLWLLWRLLDFLLRGEGLFTGDFKNLINLCTIALQTL